MKLAGAAALVLALCTSAASAQSLKQQIVGTWDFVVAEITAPDGKKSFPFGETPKGILIFTPDGRFAQIHVASDVPKFASGNRLSGTAEEYAAINRRSLALFGSYTVDEANKTVIVKFEGSSFAKFVGTEGKRVVTSIDDNEFRSMNPATSTGTKAESIWKRVK